MTVSNNPMMFSYASQVSNNKNVQSQSSASGSATQGTDGSKAFDAIAQMLMTALDTNKTGTIDKTEFSEAAKILAKSQSSENVDDAFGKIDADSNGQISSNEFMNALKEANSKKEQHKHHANANALDSTLLSNQINKLTQIHSEADEAQKSLYSKIIAAYSNTAATTGTTTNISV